MTKTRTPLKKKAKQIVKLLKNEHPDYHYMRSLFRLVRAELEIVVLRKSQKLPYVPTEEELKNFYKVVWQSKNMQNVLIVKTLLYTGARVSEFVKIKLCNIDFDRCQIKIVEGKGKKDRIVPFPSGFKEILTMHADNMEKKGATFLFESVRKKKYTDRGIRKILANYADEAGFSQSVSPHKLRHFLFTWLKKQGIDDALIQPYSGHESRQSLEIYSKLSITDAQNAYENVIKNFPI